MAKKKKQSRKVQQEEYAERSAFWPYAGGVILVLLAIFVLLGGFGTGGPLPTGLFEGAYWALGWAAYLVPIALVYFAAAKFLTVDKRVPLPALVSMFALVILAATWLHTSMVTKQADLTYSGGHGGRVGKLFGDLALGALDKAPASIMFFVFTVLLFFLTFGISPRILMNVFRLFKRPEQEDTDLATLKGNKGFVLKEGVPVEHNNGSDASARTTLKNTAQKLASNEDHEALTTFSDPDWKLPGLDLLSQKQEKADAGDIDGNAKAIKETLANFNIPVEMEGANVGPRVTQFTLRPPTGVKLTKITQLENNLALDLAAQSIRVEAPIPGKRAVGIEVPNIKAASVTINSMFQTDLWKNNTNALQIAIGKDIAGDPIYADLARMPHLLVAGQTNSGKSVMINTLLTSLLYNNSPSDLKMILVDPKHVELNNYEDIPHLLTPVITEPEKCISALKWAVAEMERRYKTLKAEKKKNIQEYNLLKKEEGMPYIVIVVDELADLMMMAARDVESLIVRIAQKARAVGIHLVVATQSPRVTVITGLIKANIPARIAFTVSQEVESRIILDQSGAEKLLGMGDMMFITSEMPKPKRIQGALITTEETQSVTDFLRMQRPPQYDDEVVSQPVQLNGKGGIVADYGGQDADDDMFKEAVQAVIDGRKASTSLLQRRLRIGYGRAARLIETMEEQGIIGHADGNRPREVLVSSLDDVFNDSAVVTPESDDVYDDIPDDPKDE